MHGAIYSSATWVDDIPTVQTVAAAGVDAVAIDMPGSGQSSAAPDGSDPAGFAAALLAALAPAPAGVVAVSPSASGAYGIPLAADRPDLLCGYVPVAPSVPSGYGESADNAAALPVMAVVGERDSPASTETVARIFKNTKKEVRSHFPLTLSLFVQLARVAGHRRRGARRVPERPRPLAPAPLQLPERRRLSEDGRGRDERRQRIPEERRCQGLGNKTFEVNRKAVG